jgi:hypothetical protein
VQTCGVFAGNKQLESSYLGKYADAPKRVDRAKAARISRPGRKRRLLLIPRGTPVEIVSCAMICYEIHDEIDALPK